MAEPDPMVQLEAAIVERLTANTLGGIPTDPDLASTLPGGLHSRTAGGEAYPFATLTLVRMDSQYTFRRAYRHQFRYGISVTDESESIDMASAALERIYDLIQDATPAQMPMEDFVLGFARRIGRTGITPTQDGTTIQRITDEYRFEVYPND